ncbi:MAG TPA: HAD family phosphatase [Sediminibacterium sp.]|nr:HAD family phosphatase [Sediminibacterium sp.]HQS54315.1 HAD family phosphatase [Sediminibacterium sp.]
MSQPIQAIIFDLDGVIIDSNPAIVTFWDHWAKQFGFELTQDMILEWVYGRKVTATIEGLFSKATEEEQQAIRDAGYAFDAAMHPTGIEGVQDFVQALKVLDFPRGVATSSHKERMEQMLERIGLPNHFEFSITAHDVTLGKPHPEPYLKMAQKLGIEPSNCLVFEDAISGVQSANAAGMICIGIGNAFTAEKLKAAGAKEVIENFTQLHIRNNTMTTSNNCNYSLI